MITNDQIMIVKQLIMTGLSQRLVAKQTGLSRGSIHAIIRGKRDVIRVCPRPEIEIERSKKAPFVKCPECGAMVRLPCAYCFHQKLRKWRKNCWGTLKTATPLEKNDNLRINLSGDEEKRYQEVRKWRENHSEPHFTIIPDNWPFSKK